MRSSAARFPGSAQHLLFSALLLFSGSARATGFSLNEMSAASIGNAFAGNAAIAEDASTIYYNPAGLSRMTGQQFTITGSALRPSIRFSNAGSISTAGRPLTGGNGGDAGDWTFVPALYYATDLGRGLRFGIGLQSPFGLKTEYDEGWVGRYQALKSELQTIDINPTLAYKVNDSLSLGAGISAQYTRVELSRAIDFGSVCVGRLGAASCAPLGFLPQAKDGRITLEGTDWGYGFNLGVLFAPSDSMRFGLAYRSRIRHDVSGGSARFDKPAGLPAPLAAATAFSDTDAAANIDLPESLNFSAYADLAPRWAVMSDINWTRWSRFNELRVRFANGAPDSVIREDWRNSFRLGIGVNYRYSNAWKLRTGIAYEQSPVRDESRTANIPDADRTLLAFGVQHKPSRQSAWDFGYVHIFVKDASINRADPPLGGTLIGNYGNDVNILSVQYSHSF